MCGRFHKQGWASSSSPHTFPSPNKTWLLLRLLVFTKHRWKQTAFCVSTIAHVKVSGWDISDALISGCLSNYKIWNTVMGFCFNIEQCWYYAPPDNTIERFCVMFLYFIFFCVCAQAGAFVNVLKVLEKLPSKASKLECWNCNLHCHIDVQPGASLLTMITGRKGKNTLFLLLLTMADRNCY